MSRTQSRTHAVTEYLFALSGTAALTLAGVLARVPVWRPRSKRHARKA